MTNKQLKKEIASNIEQLMLFIMQNHIANRTENPTLDEHRENYYNLSFMFIKGSVRKEDIKDYERILKKYLVD